MTGAEGKMESMTSMGLRERKKIKTRETIRHAAYRLFAEHGYEATTVEQIAEAAEVSPSTFFRYFPTKEDVVLTDEYDDLFAAALRDRPADEHWLDSMRVVFKDMVHSYFERDRDEAMLRMRLSEDVPALRARMYGQQVADIDRFARVLAERTGRDVDDIELRAAIGAVAGAFGEAFRVWYVKGGTDDVLPLVDRVLDLLANGLR
jgi:AcrR family transcriptional regulator